ncbi:TIGR03085 family metal-binding protein [Nocardioides acrostichi]|uniref:TIGR03085 family protein n=1 Tax=Nocardioides acrostichi TaxID=2784339 RepID=A0A930UYB9_9ACTN|nr:TIGR03085 family metal-binding protein [Nocardioides acrostichi]MBF4160649.1 TIGR03085 family protein [Nocardioides acrostichi]
MTSFVRRERDDLCDTALAVGPYAPTLCGDWTARDLLAHLYVREHSPVAGLGVLLTPLAGLTEKAMRRAASGPYERLVGRVCRTRLTPFTLPGVEPLVNTLEYLVHHEDLRRARPDWSPREMAPDDLDAVWTALVRGGRLIAHGCGVPLRARRTDTGEERALTRGDDAVTLVGEPVELALYCFGRTGVARVDLEGSEAALAALRPDALGF